VVKPIFLIDMVVHHNLPIRQSAVPAAAVGVAGSYCRTIFGGLRLNLMAALPAPGEAARLPEGEAPDDQPDMGKGRILQRHRRAGIGFPKSPLSPRERVFLKFF
jgi:hypothetical protein